MHNDPNLVTWTFKPITQLLVQILAVQLDWWLWASGISLQAQLPFHKTRSIYYWMWKQDRNGPNHFFGKILWSEMWWGSWLGAYIYWMECINSLLTAWPHEQLESDWLQILCWPLCNFWFRKVALVYLHFPLYPVKNCSLKTIKAIELIKWCSSKPSTDDNIVKSSIT